MRTVLVVAHQTLVGEVLLREAEAMHRADPCRFHLLVPVVHPGDHLWTDGEVEAAAQKRLEEGLSRFREIDAEASGEVGDVNPVLAVTSCLRRQPVDEIVVSTLPPGISRWLRMDVVNRLTRAVGVPATHVVYDETPISA